MACIDNGRRSRETHTLGPGQKAKVEADIGPKKGNTFTDKKRGILTKKTTSDPVKKGSTHKDKRKTKTTKKKTRRYRLDRTERKNGIGRFSKGQSVKKKH